MIETKRVLPIALVAALLGGSVGAFVMRPRSPETTATAQTTQPATTTTTTATQPAITEQADADLLSDKEQAAYREGFAEGFRAGREEESRDSGALLASNEHSTATATRVVYRPVTRRVSSRSSTRRVYYDYDQRRSSGRSFWSKHRDKLTVAMGTGAGAVIGGLIGGKRGALIGGLAGAGGSALYTYKLRNRSRRY